MASFVKLPIWLARAMLIVVFVPALLWAAISRVGQELASIPKYIWWDWCDDAAAAAHVWRTGEFHQEEEW